MPVVLHVSPHPDDEALGAPATLLLLRRAGWQVVNAVVSLGRPDDHARRRREAVEAARRAGFELRLTDESPVEDWLRSLLDELAPAIVLSPSLHDAHPRHEATARATALACAATADPPVWWQWGLWADLRSPTLYVPFDDDVLAEAQHVLAAYAGELAAQRLRAPVGCPRGRELGVGQRARLRLRHRTRVRRALRGTAHRVLSGRRPLAAGVAAAARSVDARG